MKKTITLTTLSVSIIIATLSSCSKKSQGEILPHPAAAEITPSSTVAKADTPYGRPTHYHTAAKADTPYGKKPIRAITIAKIDTPYGK